jgi:hypothetical protein
VAGVGAQRGWQQHTFGAAATRALRGVGLPDWLAQDTVRDCLLALTRRAISYADFVFFDRVHGLSLPPSPLSLSPSLCVLCVRCACVCATHLRSSSYPGPAWSGPTRLAGPGHSARLSSRTQVPCNLVRLSLLPLNPFMPLSLFLSLYGAPFLCLPFSLCDSLSCSVCVCVRAGA